MCPNLNPRGWGGVRGWQESARPWKRQALIDNPKGDESGSVRAHLSTLSLPVASEPELAPLDQSRGGTQASVNYGEGVAFSDTSSLQEERVSVSERERETKRQELRERKRELETFRNFPSAGEKKKSKKGCEDVEGNIFVFRIRKACEKRKHDVSFPKLGEEGRSRDPERDTTDKSLTGTEQKD